MKKIYTLLMMVTMMVALSGCEDDYRYNDLLGRWQKISVIEDGYEYDLMAGEYEEYIFFEDGTGLYVNEFGTRVDFWWDERGYRSLTMRFSDGITEYVYYDFEYGDLVLYDDAAKRNGRVFRYTGRYY